MAFGYAVGMIRWAGFAGLAMVVTPALAQRACVMGEASRNAASTLLLQRKLLDTAVEDMDTTVSPGLRSQIGSFKDALADFVDAMMACAPADQTTAAMQADLARTLRANQPEKPFIPSPGPGGKPVKGVYGNSLKVKVTVPDKAPRLWMIELNFDIECGDDSLLLVYESTPAGWRRLMRWQSGEYAEISGAFGDVFKYGVIPATTDRPMKIVTVHGNPWCTSRFSRLGIDLLDPSPSGGRPTVAWHATRGYSRGDAETRLLITSNGFQVRTNVPADNPMDYERSVILGYRVDGTHVTRTGPIATNGRGFVDEWLNMSWDEAKEQITPAALNRMKPVYDRFYTLAKSSGDAYYSHEHGPVLACKAPKEFQVEVGTTKEIFVQGVSGGRNEKLPATYFRIQETGNGYRMLAASETPSPDCSGPDLMRPR